MAGEENIQKSDPSMEGVVLGLGALSETLNKMNLFLEKHYVTAADDDVDVDDYAKDELEDDNLADDDGDEEDYDDEDVDDEELAKAFLMKRGYSFKGPIKTSQKFSTMKRPVGRPKKPVVMKEDNDKDEDDEDEKMEKMIAGVTKSVLKQLMELNADKEHKVSGGDKWPMSGRPAAEDKEENVTLRSKTDEVQKPIVASRPIVKHDEAVSDDGDEHDKEYPVVEDTDKEVPTMKAQIQKSNLEKELFDLRKSMDDKIKKGVEAGVEESLKKVGFRKEHLQAQRILPNTLGAESNDPGVNILRKADSNKSGSADVTDELKDLSWSEVWNMRLAAEEARKKQDVISSDEFFGLGGGKK